MEQKEIQHEMVHFRREEIAPLKSFPSAKFPPPAICRTATRLQRWLLWPIAAFLVLVIFFIGCFYFFGVDAIGNGRLRQQAQQAIGKVAGYDVDVTLGGLRLGLGKLSLFALEVNDARILRASDQQPLVNAGTLRFGLRALPLLRGKVEVARVAITDAQLTPAQISGSATLPVSLLQASGTISPEELSKALFGAVKRAFQVTREAGLSSFSLSNVSLQTDGQIVPGLVIEELEIARAGDRKITLQGTAIFRGRDLAIDGEAERDPSTDQIGALSLKFSTPEKEVPVAAERGLVRSLGAFDLQLSGREGENGVVGIDLRFKNMLIGIDTDELWLDGGTVSIGASAGDKVFSVLEARMAMGRTIVNFQGTVGPDASTESGSAAYRLDLVSRDSVMAPADSPEPALPFALRLAGRYEPAASRFVAEKIDVRTAGGEMTGSASVTVPEGKVPGLKVALYVSDMPTAHVKQFWPWFAARGAREWALVNVFGGRVRDSSLTLDVPPGRLGNGVPLSDKEVFGRFELADTRFDIAGSIPPVRDGVGWVDFRGTDVNVGLSSGTIYMPSGRAVEAKNGTLAIHAVHLKPRIGKLDIDVAGAAPAIVELSSYEPIDASRFHDLSPEDLSGKVSGHITADVPLQADIPAAKLGWRVALDYEDLSVAKPFEGQMVRKAKGSMIIAPDRAEFSAGAELNGVPASLRIVEPFEGSSVEKVRHVELKLDNATRDKLFPGLEMLVSGPFSVTYDHQKDGRKKITASFTSARLDVPWIGWRKGAGIAATATFFMEEDGNTTELSDFSLRGESFAVSGTIRLSGGELQEARLDRLRFNRNDKFSASITRTGNAYAVSVEGESFDARSLIKMVLDDNPEKGEGKGAAGSAVSVKGSLQRVEGFNGENLRQVELVYSVDGKGEDRLSVRGAAASGGSVTFTQGLEGGRRTLRGSTNNSGAALRFLDIYKHMEGGQLSLALEGQNDDNLTGLIDIRNFWIVNEPRLGSLVAATREAARGGGQVDTTRVQFERGAAALSKGPGRLSLKNGVLRGPLIGSTFQGLLYDRNDNIAITGTFMPLYGINRIFGEIPVIGAILGNGQDRGLIGITYKLSGKFSDPTLDVNPISVIAPGFLREIFEFR